MIKQKEKLSKIVGFFTQPKNLRFLGLRSSFWQIQVLMLLLPTIFLLAIKAIMYTTQTTTEKNLNLKWCIIEATTTVLCCCFVVVEKKMLPFSSHKFSGTNGKHNIFWRFCEQKKVIGGWRVLLLLLLLLIWVRRIFFIFIQWTQKISFSKKKNFFAHEFFIMLWDGCLMWSDSQNS